MLETICQICIVLFGCSSIWLIGRKEKWKRWGYIIGIFSQPFWIITTIHNKQWGVLLLSIWYSYAWIQGIYNYWIKKDSV
jgi:hypothetical protein